MALQVVSVASGGMPVTDVTGLGHKFIGTPVSENASGVGLRVTKIASGGMPVYYITVKTDGSPHPK